MGNGKLFLWKNSLSLPILQTRPHLHLKNLSCTEDGLTVEEHHCSPGMKPEVLKERRDRKWLEPAHDNVEERVCLHPPRSEETRDWEQYNSSSSEMSGNRTQRDKSCRESGRAWSHSSIPIYMNDPLSCAGYCSNHLESHWAPVNYSGWSIARRFKYHLIYHMD